MTPPARRTVTFPAGDAHCTAWLYLPPAAATGRVPAVVMGHGLGATRELGLDRYAERFVAAGIAVLAFTYRGLGDSGGEPRQVLSMPRQLADWEAAIEYVAGLPEVDPDRLAVWGSSLGGGHALAVAARHPELRAAVAQCPFTDGPASAGALGIRASVALGGRIVRDLWAAVRGREPVTVPVAGRPGEVALMSAEDALPGMRSLVPPGHDWINRAAARSVLSILRYRPGRAAARIAAPVLVCISTTDTVAPPGPTERHVRRAPRGEIRRHPAGHFDFYRGAAFDELVGEQAEFLSRHLLGAV